MGCDIDPNTVNLAIASENVSDALIQYQTHALGTELVPNMKHHKPEIYAYSFPEFPIFSGTCNAASKGAHIYYPGEEGLTHDDALNRVFLLGSRFDIWSDREYIKKLLP